MSAVHVRLRVGSEHYALPIENAHEVAELGEPSAVPGAGLALLGVRNLNGQVLPVFDLARVLGIAGDPSRSRLVVAEHDGCTAGFAVDEVADVGSLPLSSEEVEAECLQGALLQDGRLIGILDVGALFEVVAKETG